jgi:pilus assembly protein TadC
MTLLFILGILLIGLAAALALRGFAAGELRIASQVRELDSYGYGRQPTREGSPRTVRSLRLAERIGRATSTTSTRILKPLERRELMAAGMYDVTVESFHGYRVIAAIALPILVLGFRIAGSGSLSAVTLLLAIVIALIVWYLPAARVRTRGQRRLDRIDRDLPELVDVLIATIEAGLGFGGSLQLVADRFEGPLGEELRLTLSEQTMGLSTEVALRHMLERCETLSVRSFVRTVLQGDSLGVSIGTTLRNLATETRQRRRATARERAQRAPLKLLFPLIFLIFPSILIVLLYPAIRSITLSLGSG